MLFLRQNPKLTKYLAYGFGAVIVFLLIGGVVLDFSMSGGWNALGVWFDRPLGEQRTGDVLVAIFLMIIWFGGGSK